MAGITEATMARRILLPQLIVIVLSLVLLGAATLTAGAAETLATGTFKGAGGHRASGAVRIIMDGAERRVVFGEDFRLRNAPDPKIAFGKDGYKPGTIFTALGKLDGAQEYAIPADVDLAAFNEIWLWCERFDVPLAVAPLIQGDAQIVN
jgi:hypothetical protein